MPKKLDDWLSRWNPNYVSSIRPVMGMIILICLMQSTATYLAICLVLLSISEGADWLDGWLARRYNKVSDWGKLYDPFCDAFSHLLIYIGLLFIYPYQLFAIFVGAILYREMYMLLLRAWSAHRGVVVAAQLSGKIKTVTQVVSIYVLIVLGLAVFLGAPIIAVFVLEILAKASLIIALFMTYFSLAKYQKYVSIFW